jgi:archaellum component FlaC
MSEEFSVQLQKVDDRSKSNTHRLDKLETWQKESTELLLAVGRIDEKVDIFNKNINEKVDVLIEGMSKQIGEIKNSSEKTVEKVQHLMDKPAKRWDSIVEKALLGAVAAIVAYLMAKIGF